MSSQKGVSSSFTNRDGSPSPDTINWHPKLTPFRVTTLLIGVGLGALNSVSAYTGSAILQFLLEWMFEAVVFAIIYLMTFFEKARPSHDADNRYRTWLYDADCMNLIWKTFRANGVDPPSYSTQEEMGFQGPDYLRPPVTNYHIIVVISLTSFAASRTMLAQTESPLAAVVLKWAFVGVVTPALYFIGLYERDPVHKLDALLRGSAIETIYLVANEVFLILWAAVLLYAPILYVPLVPELVSFSVEKYWGNTQQSRSQYTELWANFICVTVFFILVGYYLLLASIRGLFILSKYLLLPVRLIGFGMRKCGLKRFIPTNELLRRILVGFLASFRVVNTVVSRTAKVVCIASGALTMLSKQMAMFSPGLFGDIVTVLWGGLLGIIYVMSSMGVILGVLWQVDPKNELEDICIPQELRNLSLAQPDVQPKTE